MKARLTLDEFRTQLRRHGLKATRQREEVHLAMLSLVHASADQVTEEIRRRGITRVTPSSTYNILSQMADLRIYTRRLSANNKMFFDVDNSPHVHLYDRENHVYRDIVDDDLADLIYTRLKRRKFKGFTVEDIDIQLVARPTRKNRML